MWSMYVLAVNTLWWSHRQKICQNILASVVVFKHGFDPFQAHVPFLCPLKTSVHQRFSSIFRGYGKGTLA